MAYVICPKHGGSGVYMLCPHVLRDFFAGDSFACYHVTTNEFLVPKIELCADCRTEWMKLQSEDEIDDFLDRIGPVCGRCFREKQVIELT
ncbi:hypothetical protein DES53_105248 [Roseimicrobium gellanilyticum]|uniref:Uncharacterized protein n=1 Tax=Roseimicrobium gellanilyticum TaxID=748857 RepID=A0A366HLN4_9BACT|nr:hypothetical protein DES53_105248 [Roseimicrobium gellanilyticum]